MTALSIEDHFHGANLELAKAAAAGDAEAVTRAIADGGDPTAVSPGGLPLIAWPILQDSPQGVDALLAQGARADASAPGVGHSIVWAANAANPALLRAFLDKGGNPDARNQDDQPILKVAALADRWDNVKLLVERGAQIDAHPATTPGDTVLRYYSAGQFDKVHWLLGHGADPAYRLEVAPKPERIGAQPIVENIYWWPVDAGRFPQLVQWQQRCQQWISSQGISMPREPAHLQRMRLQQAGGADDAGTSGTSIDTDIEQRERALKEQLERR